MQVKIKAFAQLLSSSHFSFLLILVESFLGSSVGLCVVNVGKKVSCVSKKNASFPKAKISSFEPLKPNRLFKLGRTCASQILDRAYFLKVGVNSFEDCELGLDAKSDRISLLPNGVI